MKFKFQNFIFFIFMLIGFNHHAFAQIQHQVQVQHQNQAQNLAQSQAVEPSQTVQPAPHNNNRIKFTAAEAAWLKDHPEISVAVKHGYSPIEFIFELQEFRGISVDYLKKLEAIIGVKFNKRMADLNLEANDADMISSVTNVKSLQGTRFVALDIPFLVSPIGIFTNKTATKFDRIEDLDGKNVAVFKTGFIAKRLAEERPQINLFLVDIAEEALDAVAKGKVDAYVGNADIIKYVLKSNENETIVFAANTPYQSEIYMAVRNDWPLFKSILEKGLQSISAQEKAEILHKWTAVTYLSQINYGLIASIVIVSLVILSVFYISNRRLKDEVKQRIVLEKSLIQSKVEAEQAEDTIRQYSKELERLAMVAKHTTDSVIITDAYGLTLWVNQAFTKLTGYSLDEVVGKKPGVLLQGPETSAESIKLLHNAVSNFSDIEVDIINYRKTGEPYWIRLKIAAIVNAFGERRFIAIQTDITKQVNYIKTIENNQEDMDALFSLSPDGMVVLDSDRRISHVNKSFAVMTGLQSHRLLGLYESDLDALLRNLCAEPREYKSVDEYAQVSERPDVNFTYAEGSAKHEFKFQTQAPAQLVLERSCIETSQKRISRVIYFKDVTQRAIVENMKSEFITTAAHELRTPMSVILGYAELLKMRAFKQETRIEMIDAIHTKSTLVASLLDDLLDVAVIEYRAEKTLKLEKHAFTPFIKSIVDTFIFAGNDHRVILESIPELPDFYFDAQRFERAINNCLTNAYKFSSGSGLVSMSIYQLAAEVPELVIEIKDQGIGMTPEQLARIFEKFYRVDKSGHIPGTGLGMVLVKDILEAHGGRVLVASEINVGTTVTLILPIRTVID
jgi:PAS domain S-box-containing protein